MNIYLASKSPRRRELLNVLVDKFHIAEQNFDENTIKFNGNCKEFVIELSKGKVNSIENAFPEDIYISCDTIVYSEGNMLGKPGNDCEAFEMLTSLSGKWHEVYTGISVKHRNEIVTDCVVTMVKFSKLEEKDIVKYINSENVLDKAGAYGIQDYGGTFVEEIRGCYYNVMGLPLNKMKEILHTLNVI